MTWTERQTLCSLRSWRLCPRLRRLVLVPLSERHALPCLDQRDASQGAVTSRKIDLHHTAVRVHQTFQLLREAGHYLSPDRLRTHADATIHVPRSPVGVLPIARLTASDPTSRTMVSFAVKTRMMTTSRAHSNPPSLLRDFADSSPAISFSTGR